MSRQQSGAEARINAAGRRGGKMSEVWREAVRAKADAEDEAEAARKEEHTLKERAAAVQANSGLRPSAARRADFQQATKKRGEAVKKMKKAAENEKAAAKQMEVVRKAAARRVAAAEREA